MAEKTNCAICDCEMDASDKPKVTVGNYACTPEVARALGIEEAGTSFVEICQRCHKEHELAGGQEH
jgi:hypothetical protein